MSLLKCNFYVIFDFCVRSRSQARFTFSLVHTQSISGKAIQFSDRKLFVPTRKNCQSCKSISTSIKGSVAKYLFFLDYLWENCEWYEIDLASKISNALRFVTRRCLKSYHCTRFAELTTLEIIKNIWFNQFGHDVK